MSALVLSLASALVLVAPAAAEEDQASSAPAAAALATARAALAATPQTASRGSTVQVPARGTGLDATLALRDLFLLRGDLSATDREDADALLARPTDSWDSDAFDRGSKVRCREHVCVHFVTSGPDAATLAWVRRTLKVMEATWATEVGRLGYRRPLSDGSLGRPANGGDGRFDVYLTQLADQGLYGYCAPDFRLTARPQVGGGYCVLDDDFARAEYGAAPAETLRVTAAHEFFHAVQFAYDYTEDAWFMESTATWMEEVVADKVDDNRQYLRAGQVRHPELPLDESTPGSLAVYGQWAFWQHVQDEANAAVVRRAWRQAGAYAGAGQTFSIRATTRALAPERGFVRAYARFAADNLTPGRAYEEGRTWPSAPVETHTLGVGTPTWTRTSTLDHLTSSSVLVRPASRVTDGYRLVVEVDAQRAEVASAAYVVVVRRADGTLTRRLVTADEAGLASVSVPFDHGTVQAVSVTLVNASTRYRCDRGSVWSCEGSPRDDGLEQTLTVTATPVG
ncbi:MXAN_6640 family putative metalloprotease [Nocardioides bruguierae]|uniref:MXAN_6640 family putative metalloprotease n=1 Tax=Nocardioides bruguierae TaxID=2945102 RepID=UPI00201FC963|nr:MXAN_6640 family putative metalloprotease [Nocardioides bruguierae]MCL8024844.1 hypothetical protein [Nocardioides bruguierae]